MFRKRLKQDEDENLKSILEQRKKAIKNYRKLLTQADEKALRQIEAYTTQIKHSQKFKFDYSSNNCYCSSCIDFCIILLHC